MQQRLFVPPELSTISRSSRASSVTAGLAAPSANMDRRRQSPAVSFSLSGHALSAFSADSLPMPSNPFPAPDPLMRPATVATRDVNPWFSDASVSPWNPIQPRYGMGNPQLHRSNPPVLPSYPGSVAASECDTNGFRRLPSDSGYESLDRTRPSIINGSIYSDLPGDTASVVSGLIDHPLDQPGLDFLRPSAHQAPRVSVSVSVDGSKLVCPTCKQLVKTKSELKKHKQKHEKPHHCDVPGCPRTDGFSTTNDVDRHKKSCHPDQVPNAEFFRCNADGCRKANKNWPRADNFRQHLKRVHQIQLGDSDLEQYKYKTPELPPDLVGMGTGSVIDGNLPTGDGNILCPTWMQLDAAGSSFMEDFSSSHANDSHTFHMMPSGDSPNSFATPMLDISPTDMVSKTDPLQVPGSHTIWPDADAADDDHSSQYMRQYLKQDLEPTSTCRDDSSETDRNSVSFVGLEQAESDQSCAVGDCDQHSMEAFSDSSANHGHDVLSDACDISIEISVPAEVDDRSTSTRSETTSLETIPAPEPAHLRVQTQVEESDISQAVVNTSDIINDDTKALDIIKALEKEGKLSDLLEKLGIPRPQPTASDVMITPSTISNSNDDNLVCQELGCGKSFSRRCELKKHEKRHAKPYACTYKFCHKKFGSKNDWKRHENSQHYQLEMWKCNERTPSDIECGKTSHRREQFKAHLAKDHKIVHTRTADLESKLGECLVVGQNCESTFWCGFCKEVIQVGEKGLKAWTNRFDHIDSHFSGRGRPKLDISQWEHQDDVQMEQSLQPAVSAGHSSPIFLAGLTPTSALRPHANKSVKRPASDEGHHQPSRKKGPGLFYCCRCHNQLDRLVGVCFTSDCNGHRQCDNCNDGTVQDLSL